MSKHTPGPWHVDPKSAEESFFEDVYVLRHDGLAIAVCVHNGDILPPEPEANGRLIASAPELLECLKAMVAETVEYATINKLGDAEQQHNVKWARSIIAKAEGGAA
jgi:hypothetical protein